MSVQSEITRLSGNVSAALAAIAEKGVTVGSDANSDDLAALIASIEAGGGGVGDIKITSGTYTPSEETERFVIEQDFGGTPFALVIWNTAGALGDHIKHAVFILTDSGSSPKVNSLAMAKNASTGQFTSVGLTGKTLAEGEWRNGYIHTPAVGLGYCMRDGVKQSWRVYAI